MLRNYYAITKILKDFDINKRIDQKLRKILLQKHIPVNNKWETFFKLNYPKDRDIKQDRAFLQLFSTCRNSLMHNNTISYKTETFNTRLGDFTVIKGEFVDFISNELILNMVYELSNIFIALCNSFNFKDEITDPFPLYKDT